MNVEKPKLLFDGECKFCNFWVSLIQKQRAQDKFSYFTLESDKGKALLMSHNIDSSIDSIVVIANGKAYDKSSAALYIAKELGGFWYLVLITWLVPKPIRDWIYDILAKNRHKFFKNRNNCKIHP